MNENRPLNSIPDDELVRRLIDLLCQSRRVESEVVAHIGEVDERRLYAREASPSMFAYCTEVLHFSEAEAYLRIAVARAAREHPMLLAMLADGRLHLTGIAKLAPYLTRENREGLLKRATHKSKRRIEELIADIAPMPDVPPVPRRLPTTRTELPAAPLLLGPDRVQVAFPELRPDAVDLPALARSARALPVPDLPASPPSAPLVRPLAPGRYKVQFTASAELYDKLQRLQAHLRSKVPDGDLAAIIETAVTEKLEGLEARRYAKTSTPRKGLADANMAPTSRHIPAPVKRAVSKRDGNRCRYVDELGRRCSARDRLEFHHRHPFGHGGDHSLQNIGLLCHTHNAYLAKHDYGKTAMARCQPAAPEPPGRPWRPGQTERLHANRAVAPETHEPPRAYSRQRLPARLPT